MSDRRRGLGRGLGALIPEGPRGDRAAATPTDVFFAEHRPPGEPGGPALVVARPDVAGDPPGHGVGAGDGEPREHGGPGGEADGGGASRPTEGPGSSGLREVPGARFTQVPVDAIEANPRQPRTVFDEDDLAELVDSIATVGLLQPVIVRPVADAGDRYELVMGERRWRAARAAGLTAVPAIVKDTPDEAMLRDALLENLHRSQLNPLEEAAAYQQLLDEFGCTHDELAQRLSRSRPQITNTVRLLRLPPLVARRVAAGVLSAGHARALLALTDPAAMERLAQRIVAEGLSVRAVEEIVALGEDGTPRARRAAQRTPELYPELDDIAARLSDRFDTRVLINMGRRRGKLTVEFASVDDLHRILEVLGHEGLEEEANAG